MAFDDVGDHSVAADGDAKVQDASEDDRRPIREVVADAETESNEACPAADEESEHDGQTELGLEDAAVGGAKPAGEVVGEGPDEGCGQEVRDQRREVGVPDAYCAE